MPFLAAKASPADPDLAPPLVNLTYFSIGEANAARDMLPAAQHGKRIGVPLWQLNVPFGYVRPSDAKYFDIPAHTGNVAIYSNHTDLASIPGFLWGVLAPFGRQLRPALLHDRRCDLAHAQLDLAHNEPDPAQAEQHRSDALATRKEADYLFRESLRAEGVGPTRRVIFWAGVSFGRFLGYQQVRGVLLAIAVTASALVALHSAALSAHVTVWAANRWLFATPFWLAVGGLFIAMWLLTRRSLLAMLLPVVALLFALLAAGTGPSDGGRLHSWWTQLTLAGGALLAALIMGAFTDIRVALIGVAVSPIVMCVIAVTLTAELLLALPDLAENTNGEGGGLGPIMPTILRWRVR